MDLTGTFAPVTRCSSQRLESLLRRGTVGRVPSVMFVRSSLDCSTMERYLARSEY